MNSETSPPSTAEIDSVIQGNSSYNKLAKNDGLHHHHSSISVKVRGETVAITDKAPFIKVYAVINIFIIDRCIS